MMKGYRLLLLFVIILLFGQLQTFAQNNAYKINDTLYEYFRKAQNNLKVPGKGLLMADTLYVNAQKLNDVKAQALALYLRVSYYHNQENRDGERREFERISPILLKSPYLQYYFGAWMIIIIDHINNREYPQALIELGKFYDKAKELKSSYGILESYIIQGDLFFQRALFRLALPQYNKALKYAKENNLTDISTLYRRIGECCFSLQRWHDAEIAIQKGMEAYPDQQHSMTYLMLLLQTYCCMDTIVPSKIEQTYNKLQSLMARYPLINNYRVFYYRTMYYYHEYYTKDRAQALYYVQQGQKDFLPDSLIYYWKKGKEYDNAGNIREAAKCYRNYIHQAQIVREDEDKFLISSFVPQLDYQKVLHERELLSQKTTLMRLKRMKDSEQLMSLNEERDRLTLLDREKEHTILQNRLLVQKMLLKKQNQRLINQRIYNAQQKKTEQLRQNQFRWRVALNLFILVLLLIGLSVYLLRKYHTRKTLRLEKEKAEKAKQMKSLFFQNMNHEIRSPLNAIIGFNDVLNGSMAEDLPAEQKAEFVKMISTNCLLLQTLVNDVLDLSNFESGSYKLSPVDVDINHLCRTALESIRGRENDGVELIFKPSPDGVFILRTDAQRLQQVLTNYLSNACKYTEKGSITLSYDVLDNMVRFAVTDTGVGVRSEDAEKVFERFQMLDKSKRGTGLGLHICRLISKLLHGKVYLDTSYKSGSRFVFEHPLKALLTLIIALFCSAMPMKAQNNPEGMQDKLYNYYQKIEAKINQPIALRMSDTLFVMGTKAKDIVAQTGALLNKIRYYRYSNNGPMLLKSFNDAKRFYLKHKFYDGLFFSWTYVVNYYLSEQNFDEALKQLVAFQSEVTRLKNRSGIASYFYSAGLFYAAKEQYAAASTYFLQSFNYSNEDAFSIYASLGRCYFEMKQYTKSISCMNKALQSSYSVATTVLPYTTLLMNYSILGDEANADKMYHKVMELKRKIPDWVDEVRYQHAMFLYYNLIKKNKDRAGEALLRMGKSASRKDLGDYYAYLGDHSKSLEAYKECATVMRNWLQSDPGSLLEIYTSNFDYGKAMKERDRESLKNLVMKLIDASNAKELLSLRRDKTSLLLQQTSSSMRQKRGELALQQMLIDQQRDNLMKNKILNEGERKQHELYLAGIHLQRWFVVLFLIAAVVVILLFIRYLRQREKRLREEMLEAQREERVKDRFFQNVNNKIRHPLDTIVNLNQKLNVDDASSLSAMGKAHMMEELVNTGAYLTLLVNEVLDISKMESGTYKLRLEEVDVHSLCKSVLKEASAQIASGVELCFECRSVDGGDEATTCKLTTDLQRLQFVLLSYLNNACQYTLDGSVTLSYEVYPQRIVFAVTDTGLGLTQSEMDTIFIRDQLDMDGEGVGLSLHIVKLIAELLHGDASVDRTYKKGARFLFVHPIVRSKSE